MEVIDEILDTPAKQTLWFHIIPLLEEDDQEYTKRKIRLLQSRDSLSFNNINYQRNYTYQPINSNKNFLKRNSRIDFFENEILNDEEIDNLFNLSEDGLIFIFIKIQFSFHKFKFNLIFRF